MKTMVLLSFTVLFCTSCAFATEEDSIILQNGILPTNLGNYLISNEFELRTTHDGKFIRLSGITAEGYPYYVIQKTQNDLLSGFIYTANDKIIRINSQIILEDESTSKEDNSQPEIQMVMKIGQPDRGQFYDSYRFTAKVFDAMINPNPTLSSFDGTLENIAINVTLSKDDIILTSFSGITDSKGIFEDQYRWQFDDSRGTYDVSVRADNGNSVLIQNLTTYYGGYIPPDSSP